MTQRVLFFVLNMQAHYKLFLSSENKPIVWTSLTRVIYNAMYRRQIPMFFLAEIHCEHSKLSGDAIRNGEEDLRNGTRAIMPRSELELRSPVSLMVLLRMKYSRTKTSIKKVQVWPVVLNSYEEWSLFRGRCLLYGTTAIEELWPPYNEGFFI